MCNRSWRCCRFNRCRRLYLDRLRNLNLGLIEYRCSGFGNSFRRFHGLLHRTRLRLRRDRRRWGFWRHDHRRRWPRDRLRRDKARHGLGFKRSCGRSAGSRGSRLRRHRRRRRNRRPQSRRRNRTRKRGGLSCPLRDGLQHIARLGDVRQVNLGLELVRRGRRGARAAGSGRLLRNVLLDALRLVFFDRAGVRFLLGDADFGKNVENLPALDLEFSRQIIDSNLVLLHYAPSPPICSVWLRLHSILTVVVCVQSTNTRGPFL